MDGGDEDDDVSSGPDSGDEDDELFGIARGDADAGGGNSRRSRESSKKTPQASAVAAVAKGGKSAGGSGALGVANGGVQKSQRMYAARDPGALSAFARGERRGDVVNQTLAERVAAQGDAKGGFVPRRVGGSREVSFVPRGGSEKPRGGGRGGGGRGRGGRGGRGGGGGRGGRR